MARLPEEFSARDVSKITRFSSIKAAFIMKGSTLFKRRKVEKHYSGVRYYYSLVGTKI